MLGVVVYKVKHDMCFGIEAGKYRTLTHSSMTSNAVEVFINISQHTLLALVVGPYHPKRHQKIIAGHTAIIAYIKQVRIHTVVGYFMEKGCEL